MSRSTGTASSSSLRRRTFLKGIGAGIGAAGAGIGVAGAGSSPASAQVLQTTGPGVNPVSYLIGAVKNHLPGTGGKDDYAEAEARSLFVQARMDAEIIKSGNETVLTTISNLAANAKSVAYQEGRAAYLKALNDGTSVANALDPGREAIQNYIAPNQQNVIERWNVMFQKVKLTVDRAQELESTSPGNIYNGGNLKFAELTPDNVRGSFGQQEYPLVNGETALADGMRWSKDSFFESTNYAYIAIDGNENWNDPTSGSSNVTTVRVKADPQEENSEQIVVIDHKPFKEALNSLETAYNEAYSELESFANGIKDKYQQGEIKTEDLVTPRDLWEMSSEDAENPYAAADLAGLGLEVNQESTMVIRLLDEDEELQGSIYMSESPTGTQLQVGSVYDPEATPPENGYGKDQDQTPLPAGTEDDPVALGGLVFIAYNTDSGSTYSQIKQPFEVISAVNEDGEELEEITYEPAPGQQTTTTDIQELKDELNEMNEELKRVEEERRKAAQSTPSLPVGLGDLQDTDPRFIGAALGGLTGLLAGGS